MLLQVMRSNNETIYLLSAYLDDRDKSKILIRLIGMSDRDLHGHGKKQSVFFGSDVPVDYFCKIWYNERSNPVTVKVNELRYLRDSEQRQVLMEGARFLNCYPHLQAVKP